MNVGAVRMRQIVYRRWHISQREKRWRRWAEHYCHITTTSVRPCACWLKRRVIRSHFCQQKKQAAGPASLQGRCDSLHSNYGSALFLCSTLGSAVQSQTGAEQRGSPAPSLARRWCAGKDHFFLIFIAERTVCGHNPRLIVQLWVTLRQGSKIKVKQVIMKLR